VLLTQQRLVEVFGGTRVVYLDGVGVIRKVRRTSQQCGANRLYVMYLRLHRQTKGVSSITHANVVRYVLVNERFGLQIRMTYIYTASFSFSSPLSQWSHYLGALK